MKFMGNNICILGIIMALAVTGCGKSTGVVVRNDNAVYAPQGNYGSGADASESKPESAQSESEQPEGTQSDSAQSEGEQSESAQSESEQPESELSEGAQVPEPGAPATKQPPEGFELKLEGSEWGVWFGEGGTQPIGNAEPGDLAWYNAYFMGSADEKVIYLTFNCGYDNANTGKILDVLKKHNAPATFFVLGYFLENEPDMVKRMAAEGHAVGNHTYSYLDMTKASGEVFKKELNDVENKFYEITGTKLSPYYRPPMGRADAADIKMVSDLGYYTIFWSLAYMDWDQNNQPGRGAAIEQLTSLIHPGAVVLLNNASRTNTEILDELLTKWEGMGYRFAPLSELVSR